MNRCCKIEIRKRHTYICKKKADGKTLPIPVASTLVRGGLSASSSLDYTVLLIMLVLLALLLVLIWIGYRQYKKRKEPTQVANLDQNQRFVSGAVSSTSIGAARPSTSQITTNATPVKQIATASKHRQKVENEQTSSEHDSPRLSMTPNQPGVVPLETSSMAYDQHEEMEEMKNQARQHMYEHEELGNGSTMEGLKVGREMTTLTTSTMQTNLALSHASTTGSRIRTRRKSFERPHIGALDSVSAISMDEFWQKQS